MDVGDDGAAGRLEPLAVLGDVGEDAQGAEDGGGGRRGLFGAFDDAFADAAKIEAAALEKSGGGSVAVNGRARGERKFVADSVFGAPVDEVGFDGFAIGMLADGAFASVASERRFVLCLGSARGRAGRPATAGRLGRVFAFELGVEGFDGFEAFGDAALMQGIGEFRGIVEDLGHRGLL